MTDRLSERVESFGPSNISLRKGQIFGERVESFGLSNISLQRGQTLGSGSNNLVFQLYPYRGVRFLGTHSDRIVHSILA